MDGCKIVCLGCLIILVFYSRQNLSAFLIGIVRNINIAGFQSGKRIKGVVWEKQEVGSSGFLSSFEARKMA